MIKLNIILRNEGMRGMSKNTELASVLIITGIMLFFCNTGNSGGEAFLFIVSAGFFIAYFMFGRMKGKYIIGFIIPACLVFMVSCYTLIEENIKWKAAEGALFFFMIATGFLMIYLIHYVKYNGMKFGVMKWPLVTAIPIYAFGVFVLLMENYNIVYVRYMPAILLIGVGVLILLNSFKKKV